MTLWIYLVDPKDHILKGLCHLYFWLSYKHMSHLLHTSDKQTDRHWRNLYKTTILGRYTPLILAPVEGCWVGLQPITWAFGPITI